MKRNWIWMMAVLVFFVGVAYAAESGMVPAAPTSSANFMKLKSLVGSWEGTSTSQMHGEQPAKVDYKLTSGGSALVETLFPGTDHEMVSVYHDRKGSLSMTHYCMLRNQPELDVTKSGDNQIVLDFSPRSAIEPNESHMHRLTITFTDPDHIVQEWAFYDGGEQKDATKISLTRVK